MAVILAAALAFGLQQAGVRRGMIIVVVVIITALSLARYRPVSTSSHQEETVKFTPPFSLTEETDDFGKDKKMVLVLAGNNKGVDGPVIKSLIKKYPGYGIWFVGSAPDKTFVQFGDKKLPLDAKWGEQFGAPTFFGPEGETVEIILAPISR
ncbi:MAG TPA: hypothetical protein PLH22_01030 [Candidatus Colwellbacteria bacterium]|nr:hypothetical protein [Candidatus Colwellbacteria bacterium]